MDAKQLKCHRGLIRATLHMVNREFGALADDFITLGLLPPGADRYLVLALQTILKPAAPHCLVFFITKQMFTYH